MCDVAKSQVPNKEFCHHAMQKFDVKHAKKSVLRHRTMKPALSTCAYVCGFVLTLPKLKF